MEFSDQKYFLKEGQSLLDGTYLIEKVLGNGTFAQVYRALHVKLRKWVAVKQILRSVMQTNPKLISLYKSEVKILKMINDTNVVKYIDHFSENHSCFIVMEFCNQGNLEELLEDQKKFNEKTAIHYFKQIIHGYKAIHQFKVVHRDLKAQNILIHQGVLKIADFGFAKILQEPTKSILGTPATTAPEILRGVNYGFEVDVYSLGIVLYNMLFGEYPYNAVSQNWQNKIQMEQIQFEKNGVIISDSLKDLLKRMICYSRQDRIKWADIFLHPILTETQISTSMPILPEERQSPVKISHQRTPSKALTMPTKMFNKNSINILNIQIKMSSRDTEEENEIRCFENKVNSKNSQVQPKKMKVNNGRQMNGLNNNKNIDCEGLQFQQNQLSTSIDIPDELEQQLGQYTNQQADEEGQSSPLKITAQRGIEFCKYQIKIVNQIFEILRLSMSLPKEHRCKFLIFLLSKKAYCTILDIESILSNEEPFFSKSQLEQFISSGWYHKLAEKVETEGRNFEKLYYASRNEAIHELQVNPISIRRRNSTESKHTINTPTFCNEQNNLSFKHQIVMQSCLENNILMGGKTHGSIHNDNTQTNSQLSQNLQIELCFDNEECISVSYLPLLKSVIEENISKSSHQLVDFSLQQLRSYFLKNIFAIQLYLMLTNNLHLLRNQVDSEWKFQVPTQSQEELQQQREKLDIVNERLLAEQSIEIISETYSNTLAAFQNI